MGWDDRCLVNELIGKSLTDIRKIDNDEIFFVVDDGTEYELNQDISGFLVYLTYNY